MDLLILGVNGFVVVVDEVNGLVGFGDGENGGGVVEEVYPYGTAVGG